MKQNLVLGMVVSFLLCATSLSWAIDFKWGGDYRLRGFYIENLADQDDDTTDTAAYYSSRFLLTTTASEDNVTGVVTLIIGNTNLTGNRLLGATPYGPDASPVGFLEAYIKADFTGWSLKGGRQVFKLGNGLFLKMRSMGL